MVDEILPRHKEIRQWQGPMLYPTPKAVSLQELIAASFSGYKYMKMTGKDDIDIAVPMPSRPLKVTDNLLYY